jgi:HPt (histidine-containing phosphotransfer) domain-containing protein
VLFYNDKQEFIGIDEEGLKLLNYATFEDLLGVCNDVADLFAKEPGYIHNFKSFGWIDFLLHADSDARSAIVHGNGRTFSCTLQVNPLFLTSNPSQNGYIIEMVHIQSISGDEIRSAPPKPKLDTKIPVFKTPEPVETEPSILPNYDHITPTPLSEPGILDVPSYQEPETTVESIDDIYAKLSLPLSDEELENSGAVLETEPAIIEPIPKPEPKIDLPMLGDTRYTHAEKEFINTLKVDKSYRFDPNVAAKELGLPVDLIQEFIGDFIQQAYEFKEELFEASMKGDINNLKILSHKLKGVAANLRIEDAFETLSIINTSNDPVEIEANLKYFYTIIEKLEGKEPVAEIVTAAEEKPTIEPIQEKAPIAEEDIYSFALKENEPLLVQEEEIAPAIHLDEPFEKDFFNESLPVDEVAQEEPEIKEMTKPLHYDKALIAGQLGIELDFFNELVNEYRDDALRAANEITASIGAFDTHAWKRTAAQLKGISDNLRLSEISDELAILSQTNDAQEAHKASKRLNGYLEQL